jgi:hypothetical protein
MNIVEFIKNNDIYHIESNLNPLIKDINEFCDELIGKGGLGKVVIKKVGSNIDIDVNGKTINLPVVVKTAIDNDGIFSMKIINSTLYITSYKDITAEAIIMSYVRELWFNAVTPHVPLMIGFSKCDIVNSSVVDTIVSEYHGLIKEISIKKPGFDRMPLFHDISSISKFTSKLSTWKDLVAYINIQTINEEVILPNNIKCNVVKLIDYISISFLHTAYVLYENYGMVLNDMHAGNLFIQWLSDNSFLGDKCLKTIEKISYKILDKIYIIETYGLILKLGDIGSCILHPKEDVWILGQCANIDKNYLLVESYHNPNMASFKSFMSIIKGFPYEIYSKTKIWQILQSHPYNKFAINMPMAYSHINEIPNLISLLNNFFGDYLSENLNLSETILMI